MIDIDYYMGLLQLQIFLTETIQKKKSTDQEWESWGEMLENLNYIVNYYEKEM